MKEAPNGRGVNGKCPSQHMNSTANASTQPEQQLSTYWAMLFTFTNNFRNEEDLKKQDQVQQIKTSDSTCPIVSKDNNSLPASIEEAARYAQTPQPDQTIVLNIERQVSSIPRSSSTENKVPDHQLELEGTNTKEDEDKKWVYPSEQQMYNAMRKKGWDNVPEESIPVVLQIHNHINERTWDQILQWENTNDLELVKFQGRPNDLSPKAYILSSILHLYDPPFDRHDWYVQHKQLHTTENSTNVLLKNRIQRYVIDYYYLSPKNPNMPLPIPYIDARPALDNPYALYLHTRRFLQLAFPGITSYLLSYNDKNRKER